MPASRTFRRTLVTTLATSLAAATLLVASIASAGEPATVVLSDGSVLSGELADIVNGDHLSLKMPNGELKTIAWTQIGSMQIGASGTIIIGGGTAAAPAPTPAPPPPVVYAPAPPPPPVVYAPPPPAPTYSYPIASQPAAPPRARFQPSWSFGGRFGTISPGKTGDIIGGSNNGANRDNLPVRNYVGGGVAIEGDVGYHFSPAWTFYGFWEHGFLGKGDTNSGVSGDASSNFVGFGMNANTNPDGPIGFYFDVGAGYRWLSFPYSNTSGSTAANGTGGVDSRVTVSGFEALRLGIGMSMVMSPTFRLDLMLNGTAGYFSHVDDSATSSCTTADCTTIPSDRRAVHSFGGLTIAGHWDML